MKLSDFAYDLPEAQIAQQPLPQRDQSRLLVVDSAISTITHHRFSDLESLLQAGDVLIVNRTKVFPARLRGRKKTGGKVELLLLALHADQRWRCLVRGATSAMTLEFPEGLLAHMSDRNEEGEWMVRFESESLMAYLERHGEMPLPPYIKRAGRVAEDLNRYQTVFARESGAVAAPTAGFHFTPELLERLTRKGIRKAEITLHVGWGTFRPVRTERVEDHVMLPERYVVTPDTAKILNEAQAQGRRRVAVGTTSVRTLETVADDNGRIQPGSGESSLFIYPGYRFKAVDALITNFHLPDSTPLLLANAFHNDRLLSHAPASAPTRPSDPFTLRAAYASAVQMGYRFYSYGDAMMIR